MGEQTESSRVPLHDKGMVPLGITGGSEKHGATHNTWVFDQAGMIPVHVLMRRCVMLMVTKKT